MLGLATFANLTAFSNFSLFLLLFRDFVLPLHTIFIKGAILF